MEILHTLAGYSMAHADLARRAINKKRPDVLKMQREIFVYGSDGKDGLPAWDGCLKRGSTKKPPTPCLTISRSIAPVRSINPTPSPTRCSPTGPPISNAIIRRNGKLR